MTTELKPCPFCGATNVGTYPDQNQGYKWGFAECECSARGPEVRTQYEEGPDAPWRNVAIAAWNDRATPTAPVALAVDARDERGAWPSGWALKAHEDADRSWLTLVAPTGAEASASFERGSICAQILQDFLIARAALSAKSDAAAGAALMCRETGIGVANSANAAIAQSSGQQDSKMVPAETAYGMTRVQYYGCPYPACANQTKCVAERRCINTQPIVQQAYSAPFTTDVAHCCGDPATCNDPCQDSAQQAALTDEQIWAIWESTPRMDSAVRQDVIDFARALLQQEQDNG